MNLSTLLLLMEEQSFESVWGNFFGAIFGTSLETLCKDLDMFDPFPHTRRIDLLGKLSRRRALPQWHTD